MSNGEILGSQAQIGQDSSSTIYLAIYSWTNGFTSLGLSFHISKLGEITEDTPGRLLWINIRVHLEKNMYLLASDDIGYLSASTVSPKLVQSEFQTSVYDLREQNNYHHLFT